MTYAISQYLFNEKRKCDKVVVETQVLGVKPPQICKKIIPKSLGIQKKKKDQKFGDAKKEKINNNMHQCWKQLTCYILQGVSSQK